MLRNAWKDYQEFRDANGVNANNHRAGFFVYMGVVYVIIYTALDIQEHFLKKHYQKQVDNLCEYIRRQESDKE